MSAAFQLHPPEPKRDKRLDFEFGAEVDNERLANLVTSYGVGTRSYNRSAEKRELDRQIAEAKARAADQPKQEYLAPLLCPCPQREYPHELLVHGLLRREAFNPAKRFQWPFSLMLSERRELSTEGQ